MWSLLLHPPLLVHAVAHLPQASLPNHGRPHLFIGDPRCSQALWFLLDLWMCMMAWHGIELGTMLPVVYHSAKLVHDAECVLVIC